MKRFFLTAMIGLLTLPTLAMGDIITQWNFNSNPPDSNTSTGTLTPSTGSGSIGLIGGTSATFAGGILTPSASTDPAPAADNSAWNTSTYAVTAPNMSAGIEGFVDTTGYTNITVRWDQRHSNTSSRFVAFFYTTDGGTTWAQATNPMLTAGTVNGTLNPNDDSIEGDYFRGGSGDRFHNLRTVDLSTISLAGDNPNFGFRVVAAYGPSASAYTGTTGTFNAGGTWRFDMFTIEGTAIPEPAAASLLGLLSLALVGYRRRG